MRVRSRLRNPSREAISLLVLEEILESDGLTPDALEPVSYIVRLVEKGKVYMCIFSGGNPRHWPS